MGEGYSLVGGRSLVEALDLHLGGALLTRLVDQQRQLVLQAFLKRKQKETRHVKLSVTESANCAVGGFVVRYGANLVGLSEGAEVRLDVNLQHVVQVLVCKRNTSYRLSAKEKLRQRLSPQKV